MANCRTTLFKDPNAALASFRQSAPKPNLLITDYDMPDMTGAELIRQCKTIHAPLKTILITGFVNAALANPSAPQPDIFITKPFGTGKLLEAVRGLLGQS